MHAFGNLQQVGLKGIEMWFVCLDESLQQANLAYLRVDTGGNS